MDDSEKLERLIAEQAADMKRGDYQDNEPGVISYSSFEHPDAHEYVMTHIDAQRDVDRPECYLHGRQDLKLVYGTYAGWRCVICEGESGRKYRSRPEVREKLRQRTKDWKAANRERVRTYAREYKKRRYQEDPEYRAKEQARARAWKERRKDAQGRTPTES